MDGWLELSEQRSRRDFDDELKTLEQHEPNLYKAVNNIFHDSYEYTRQYRAFRKGMEEANEMKKL